MSKVKGFSLLLLVVILALIGFNRFEKVSAQTAKTPSVSSFAKPDRAADLMLADKIDRLTNRRSDNLFQSKTADGGTELDLGGGFQNVMLARLENDGEPLSACVTSLGEANSFFGRNLQTGESVPQTQFARNPIEQLAARHGMSKGEYEFYTNLIEQAKNRPSLTSSATITILNADGAGEGFNDATAKTAEGGNQGATLGQQRLNLFNFAANIWGGFLDTNVPIVINSQFNSLTPCSTSGGVLGSAGTTSISRDFPNAPLANTWYPTALAAKLSGADRNGTTAEINATFNSDIDTGCLGSGTRFYYGLDNTTPSNTVNLLVVLLHEMGHGLGFQSFVNGATGQYAGSDTQGRFADVFTRLMYDRTTGKNWSQMTDAERVTSSTNAGNVLFDGANVRIASAFLTAGRETSTGRVQLYTPAAYEAGSSISHWDVSAAPNLLMEPNINRGLPLTLDLTRQVTRDLGWYRDTNADLTPDTITNVQVNNSTLPAGSTATVSWTNNGGFARNVTIELSTDGGATFTAKIANDIANSGSYSFTVPNSTTSQAQIRVREADFVAPSGSSANFSIGSAAPVLYDITGKVLYSSGRAFSSKVLVKIEAGGYTTRYVPVNSNGYFRFAGVPSGATYTISVIAKRYVFAPQTVTVTNGSVSNLTFTAQP